VAPRRSDAVVSALHAFAQAKDAAPLAPHLRDDIVFRSPYVMEPKLGKELSLRILGTAIEVFEDFRYLREWVRGPGLVLEFSARVRGVELKGMDLLTLDGRSKVREFEVLVRPFEALRILGAEMGRRLEL